MRSNIKSSLPIQYTKTKTASPRSLPGLALLAALMLLASATILQAYQVSSSQVEEENFAIAVQEYTHNNFTDARTIFEGIRRLHVQEAKEYLDKIKRYKEAMDLANSQMHRSADELDIANLNAAIGWYEDAIRIKPDGPGNPQAQLEKAKKLRESALNIGNASTEKRDKDLCQNALKALSAHDYKRAVQFSSPLANDNPGYRCGDYDAVQLRDLASDLAKAHPGAPVQRPEPSQGAFDQALQAYTDNDFGRARALFAAIQGQNKSRADEYVTKIDNYTKLMQQGEQARRASNYGDARTAYEGAAGIKADGPENPTEKALLIDLEQGISEFYGGNYVEAAQYLERFMQQSARKKGLASFYKGASQLGQYYLSGAHDEHLQMAALNDFRIAKQTGFRAEGQAVSPKILQVYKNLSSP